MPLKNDQHDNARRLGRLNVSRTVEEKAYREDRVQEALSELLTSPSIARCVRACVGRLLNADPLTESCRLIEQVARPSPARAA